MSREFFTQVKGRYREEMDRTIEQLEGMLYGEEKVASLMDLDARWGYKDEGRPFCGYNVHVACDESELVTSKNSQFFRDLLFFA